METTKDKTLLHRHCQAIAEERAAASMLRLWPWVCLWHQRKTVASPCVLKLGTLNVVHSGAGDLPHKVLTFQAAFFLLVELEENAFLVWETWNQKHLHCCETLTISPNGRITPKLLTYGCDATVPILFSKENFQVGMNLCSLFLGSKRHSEFLRESISQKNCVRISLLFFFVLQKEL